MAANSTDHERYVVALQAIGDEVESMAKDRSVPLWADAYAQNRLRRITLLRKLCHNAIDILHNRQHITKEDVKEKKANVDSICASTRLWLKTTRRGPPRPKKSKRSVSSPAVIGKSSQSGNVIALEPPTRSAVSYKAMNVLGGITTIAVEDAVQLHADEEDEQWVTSASLDDQAAVLNSAVNEYVPARINTLEPQEYTQYVPAVNTQCAKESFNDTQEQGKTVLTQDDSYDAAQSYEDIREKSTNHVNRQRSLQNAQFPQRNSRLDAGYRSRSVARRHESWPRLLSENGYNQRAQNSSLLRPRRHGEHATCTFCEKEGFDGYGHFIINCPGFLGKNRMARKQFQEDNYLCANCLKQGHASEACRDQFGNPRPGCRRCDELHNSLLCPLRYPVHFTGAR